MWNTINTSTDLPILYQEWLFNSGSLTQHLRNFTNQKIEFVITQQQWAGILTEESDLLKVNISEKMWVREGLFQHQKQPWIYTRAVIPPSSLKDKVNILASGNEQSMGELFAINSELQRTTLEIAQLNSSHLYYQYVNKNYDLKNKSLWARRSLFHFHQHPLLVIELFLPEFFNAI